MSERGYQQICGVARALDLLGDRWTLLIIRELLLGPKRFGALSEALRGIGPNLLSRRLKELESAGVSERVVLAPPASVPAYALTERGERLREPVEALALWGFEMLDGPAEYERGWLARGSWLASTLAGSSAGNESWAAAGRLAVNLDIDGELFVVRCDGHRAHVRHGSDQTPDAELSCDFPTFVELALGDPLPDDAKLALVFAGLRSGSKPSSDSPRSPVAV